MESSSITLGECPFCGGGVTVGVDEYDSETGNVYFSYGDRPQYENGDAPWNGSTISVVAFTAYGSLWRRTPRRSSGNAGRRRRGAPQPPACPDCGRPAKFKSDGGDFLNLGCPTADCGPERPRPSPDSWTNGGKPADEKCKENERKSRGTGLDDMLNGLEETRHG